MFWCILLHNVEAVALQKLLNWYNQLGKITDMDFDGCDADKKTVVMHRLCLVHP